MCQQPACTAPSTPKFALGQTVITANAKSVLPELDVILALQRHHAGDWGELDEHDRQMNEDALRNGGRLFSVYKSVRGQKFYIITEWDRSVTTVLLPEDY
jgi:hypothetical protein